MSQTLALQTRIARIGNRMVGCTMYCEGIHLEPSAGVLPRALALEYEERSGPLGSVALGINPGAGDNHEQSYSLEHGNTYEAMLEFWTEFRKDVHPYHVRTRRFIDACGVTGPILWTELVKCQNPKGVKGIPPINTLRACAHLYLVEEMAAVPESWPIIAIGREPFRLASMIFPSRTVIGIPHPTGSYGLFPKLFANGEALLPKFKEQVSDALGAEIPSATWLTVTR